MPRIKRLFLTEAEVDDLLDMDLALKALEEVFKARDPQAHDLQDDAPALVRNAAREEGGGGLLR